MLNRLAFIEADAKAAAGQLDEGAIHLWRIPYASAQRREPLLAVLSAYLGLPAATVVLDQDARGKPHLAHSTSSRASDRHLEFNWSHSGDYALIAIARDFSVGVDIERLGKNLRALEIARRFFDAAESDFLATLAPPERDRAFIGLWCAKEAVLKAVGEGLSFGLARLAFQPAGHAWSLARVDPALGDIDAWQMLGFDPVPGYLGALAWRGGPRNILALCPPHDPGAG